MCLLLLVVMARHNRHLTENEKILIIALSEIKGLSKTQIAERLQISWKSVDRWITRVHEGCSIAEKQHTGRKPLLDDAAKRKAYKLLLKTGCDSATRVAAMLHAAGFSKSMVSRTTIIKGAREYAKDAHMARPVSVHTRPKKRLNDAHKKARVAFAESHVMSDWSRTLFTDRVKFVLDKPGVKYHKRIWKPAGSEWSVFTANKPSITMCMGVSAFMVLHALSLSLEPLALIMGCTTTPCRVIQQRASPNLSTRMCCGNC